MDTHFGRTKKKGSFMKKSIIAGLFAASILLCVSEAYAHKTNNNHHRSYPGRVLHQTGEVVASVFTDPLDVPRETVVLAGEVVTPFGHPESESDNE